MKFSLFNRPKVTTPNIPLEASVSHSLETTILYLESRNKYFERNIDKQPLFYPEYEISKEILEVIKETGEMQEGNLVHIVNIYNKITQVDYYNSSGWYDFQLTLGGYFRYFGYSADFEKETGLLRIEKK